MLQVCIKHKIYLAVTVGSHESHFPLKSIVTFSSSKAELIKVKLGVQMYLHIFEDLKCEF